MAQSRVVILRAVGQEMDSAEARYGTFHSTHEGLGVLVEEMHELVEAIRSNMLGSIELEAIQVAAVAARLAESVANNVETRDRSIP